MDREKGVLWLRLRNERMVAGLRRSAGKASRHPHCRKDRPSRGRGVAGGFSPQLPQLRHHATTRDHLGRMSALPVDRTTWQQRGHCTKIDPQALNHAQNRPLPFVTRSLCQHCPVQPTCLGWALVSGASEGILGGMSATERRQLRSRLIQRLGNRQIEGSPELAATVRANSRRRAPAGRDPAMV